MKRLFFCLLFVLVTINVFAFDNVTPITPGVYVDRHTDTAYLFTATTVSFVRWPSGTVIWTVSSAPTFVHYVNYVIPAKWEMVSTNGAPAVNTYIPAQTLNYFEFTTPSNSPIHAYFPNAGTQIALRFVPVTRNNSIWLDVYYGRQIFDPLGGGYLMVLYKTCAKQ